MPEPVALLLRVWFIFKREIVFGVEQEQLCLMFILLVMRQLESNLFFVAHRSTSWFAFLLVDV